MHSAIFYRNLRNWLNYSKCFNTSFIVVQKSRSVALGYGGGVALACQHICRMSIMLQRCIADKTHTPLGFVPEVYESSLLIFGAFCKYVIASIFFVVIQVPRPRWPLTVCSSNANYKLLLKHYKTVANNYFKRSRTKYKQKL